MRTDDPRLKRLSFRAWRRGFREADLILGPFADIHAPALSPELLDEFEALLDQPDQDIYAWILGREPIPPQFDGEIMRRLKTFQYEVHDAGGAAHGG